MFTGWAADADAPRTPLFIQYWDNGVEVGRGRAVTSRADVAAVYPAFGPLHGFNTPFGRPDGTHQLCLVAENLGGGANAALGCRTLTLTNNPTGTMSPASLTANTATFTGTASDSNASTGVAVRAYVDGTYAAATATTAASAAYTINVPVAEGSHRVCLYAINVGVGTNLAVGCTVVVVHNNPFGALDSATQGPGGFTVRGWTIDPNSQPTSLSVSVTVDGKATETVVAAGVRADVARYYPAAGTQHGYSLLLPITSGRHALCVIALNVGAGANNALGCTTITVQNNPIGALEVASQYPAGVELRGWTVDLNTVASLAVRVTVDGRLTSALLANEARSDVALHYPQTGALHGFSATLQLASGSHAICVTATNVGVGANSTLRCTSVLVRNDPIGNIDAALQAPGGVRISGWALDLNAATAITVRVYSDGEYVGAQTAAGAHSGIAAAFPTVGGNHGFSIIAGIGPGTHTVCVYAINVGQGTNENMLCRVLTLVSAPLGNLESVTQSPIGLQLAGWAMDRFVTSPLRVRFYFDGVYSGVASAVVDRADLLSAYPNMGAGHGFKVTVPLATGRHSVCAYAINPRTGDPNTELGCTALVRGANPAGTSWGIARVGTSDNIAASGWAIDPNSGAAVAVHITSDGIDKATVAASGFSAGLATTWPLYGGNHAFATTVNLGSGQHRVCTVAYNVGAGTNTVLGCALITTSGEGAPAVPPGLLATAGSASVTLAWTAPRSDNAPILKYQIVVAPSARVVAVGGTITAVAIGGLTNGTRYTFTLQAVNSFGYGSAAVITAVPVNIPPQITPAPIATSHYIRNLTGNSTSDAALTRAMGATDGTHNASGHSYLVLLQIGGQDESRKGVLLSAIARYVSYAATVNAMKAYLDGYASKDHPYAPLTLAIGTNSDVDVSLSAGASWAINVVNPVQAYASAHYPGIAIAGANDIEPGFSAGAAASRAWVRGYLASTTAKYVFNGSADGCSTSTSGSGCNNGWTMADLQYVSGGASPSRTISLPQIYNSAMPLQWRNISLTGVRNGLARIYFGGPLTEVTACAQAGGSCGSIGNTSAWNKLWAAISSNSSTRQSQLPYGTDLRIN